MLINVTIKLYANIWYMSLNLDFVAEILIQFYTFKSIQKDSANSVNYKFWTINTCNDTVLHLSLIHI